jgi:hypothetical protein
MGAHIIWQASEKLNLKEVGSRIKITKLAHMGQPRNDSIMNLKLAQIVEDRVQTRGWTSSASQDCWKKIHSDRVLGGLLNFPQELEMKRAVQEGEKRVIITRQLRT